MSFHCALCRTSDNLRLIGQLEKTLASFPFLCYKEVEKTGKRREGNESPSRCSLASAFAYFTGATSINFLGLAQFSSVLKLSMKGMDEDQPWNIIQEPPLGHCKKRPLMPLEGSWKLIGNENFENYLVGVGVTPLIATMVMR